MLFIKVLEIYFYRSSVKNRLESVRKMSTDNQESTLPVPIIKSPIFLPNPDDSWSIHVDTLYNSNGNKHNPLCSVVDSVSCSKEMADDVPDHMKQMCKWHRVRMATHVVMDCDCALHNVCVGDAIGRRIFRNYYDCWEIPVHDGTGLYCCGNCQNTDGQIRRCGRMNVCAFHIRLHSTDRLIKLAD